MPYQQETFTSHSSRGSEDQSQGALVSGEGWLPVSSHHLAIFSHGASGEELSESGFIRALTPFMRAPLS